MSKGMQEKDLLRNNLSKAASALGVRMFVQQDLSESTASEMVEGLENLSLENQAKYYGEMVPILESSKTEKQVLTASQDIITRLAKEQS
ncbi:hypothetical protein SAMN02910384_02657 [Pseudobutyrivibrio sp. ACV-2]|nr:hypothetical protein SAMN02910384_02657 [Pseudobutyrivibrio sp. ACV-2]